VHVPDGFLDAPTSVATGVVAAVGIGIALRGARRELDDRTAPLAGLVATFVFATQMLNFPVASMVFVALYAAGGTVDIPLGQLSTAMVGVHTLIGIGEAAITFLAVGSIVAVRPDLVYGARRVLAARTLQIREAVR
jgi:ABC-type Co2+ transport system permease subunit